MKSRRIILILVVLIVLFGLLFGAFWYSSRKNATKNGTDPISFRQFLGIGTSVAPGQDAQGELSGEFTSENPNGTQGTNGPQNGNTNTGEGGQPGGGNGGGDINSGNGGQTGSLDVGDINTSTPGFTGRPISPTGGLTTGGGLAVGGDVNGGGGITTGGGPSGSNTQYPDGTNSSEDTSSAEDFYDSNYPSETSTSSSTTKSCSEADMNIVFTADELNRLNTLQSRFNVIASTLYDDAAAQQQLALYSSFKIKGQQVSELVSFCENKSPAISDPKMKIRIPTPFYHDASRDANTFTNNPTITSDYFNYPVNYRPILDHPITATTLLERLLRINIW